MKRSHDDLNPSSSNVGPYYRFKPNPSCYSKEKYTYTRRGYKPPKVPVDPPYHGSYNQEEAHKPPGVPPGVPPKMIKPCPPPKVVQPPQKDIPKTLTPSSLKAFHATTELIDRVDDDEVLNRLIRVVKGVHRAVPTSGSMTVNPGDKQSFYTALDQMRIFLDNHLTFTLRQKVVKEGFGALSADFKPDTSEVVFDIERNVELSESCSINR